MFVLYHFYCIGLYNLSCYIFKVIVFHYINVVQIVILKKTLNLKKKKPLNNTICIIENKLNLSFFFLFLLL